MLEGTGVPFSIQVADVDEDAVKALHDPADAAGLAVELARVKALADFLYEKLRQDPRIGGG